MRFFWITLVATILFNSPLSQAAGAGLNPLDNLISANLEDVRNNNFSGFKLAWGKGSQAIDKLISSSKESNSAVSKITTGSAGLKANNFASTIEICISTLIINNDNAYTNFSSVGCLPNAYTRSAMYTYSYNMRPGTLVWSTSNLDVGLLYDYAHGFQVPFMVAYGPDGYARTFEWLYDYTYDY